MLWVILFNLFNSAPIWTRQDTRRSENNPAKQLVCYRKPLPPIRIDAIKETVHQSQIVAEECGQDYALVTYDLTSAKIAKIIQYEETPSFDNLFIFFESFYTEMSFFSSLGRMIEGSCGPYVLSECDIVVVGSINKILKGKMYNICCRGNILLAAAMQILHFKKFLNDFNENVDESVLEE